MKSKKIVDIVTIVLLTVAFGMAYYTGLVGTKENGAMMLNTKTFAFIAVGGSLMLLLVGGVSELIARIKNNAVTGSFTAFMAVQVFSFIGMCAVAIALASGAFGTDSGWIRALFIVFVAVQLVGYVQAVIYTGGAEEMLASEVAAAEVEAAEETAEQPEEYEYYYTDDDDEFAEDDEFEDYEELDFDDLDD